MELFNPHTDPSALRARLSQDAGCRVVCYCAAWCRTCDAYRPALETLADSMPQWTFIWVDVEDSPDWLGDEDIENFPTILVQDREGTRFWGVQLPYVEHLRRLLEGAGDLPVLDAGPGSLDTLARG
ncbi:thioredoxin family protein [Castellaniella sp. MT123]|uniref:thioredoxin family protein n=1 Tax=Castellaniella sp. MT123 TaxID=3140381 RepID=UPI0031F3D4D3